MGYRGKNRGTRSLSWVLPTENGTASGVVADRKDKVEPKKRAAKDPAELG
jgi:hypothetical protein